MLVWTKTIQTSNDYFWKYIYFFLDNWNYIYLVNEVQKLVDVEIRYATDKNYLILGVFLTWFIKQTWENSDQKKKHEKTLSQSATVNPYFRVSHVEHFGSLVYNGGSIYATWHWSMECLALSMLHCYLFRLRLSLGSWVLSNFSLTSEGWLDHVAIVYIC